MTECFHLADIDYLDHKAKEDRDLMVEEGLLPILNESRDVRKCRNDFVVMFILRGIGEHLLNAFPVKPLRHEQIGL